MPSARKLLRVTLLTAALSALCALGVSAAPLGVGTVNDGGLRLRAQANTTSAILASAPKGATVSVVAEVENGWYQVEYLGLPGYMFGKYLDVTLEAETKQAVVAEAAEPEPVLPPQVEAAAAEPDTGAAEDTPDEGEPGYGLVNTYPDYLNLRSGPSTGYDILTSLPSRTVVAIDEADGDWYKVTYHGVTGYVSGRYILPCSDASGTLAGAANGSELGQQIVEYAKTFLGVPYVYAGNGPYSFDCSGFTKYVYAHFGYSLNRSQVDQLQNGTPVPTNVESLQPGDLIFFDNNPAVITGHVGIYIGDGQFIHASTNKYQVEIRSLYDWNGYYLNILKFARRII